MSLAWLDKEPDIFCSDQRPAPGIGTMATLRLSLAPNPVVDVTNC